MGIDKSNELQARGLVVRMSTVFAAGFVLAATPALSQGAVGPGPGAPMAPQPRVAPAAPAPVVPQAPVVIPSPSVTQPGLPRDVTKQPASEPAAAPKATAAIIGGIIIAAPKVLSPANGATVGGPDSKTPVTFHWTPLIPKPQEPVTYRLRVWQLMQGQNGTQAMQVNQPVVTRDVDNINQGLIASPSCSQNTCSFVWSVQALNRDGKPIGENNGTSDPSGFKTAGIAGGTTTNPGTTSPAGEPAGLKGTTAVVALLALQTNNTSSSIFDRWGNLFAESKGNRSAPNLSIVLTDRARGSVGQTTTDQRGLFKVPSTPGVHEITLPAKDLEAAYIKITEIKGDQSPEQALHGAGWLVAILALKVPGTAPGGGKQDFGLARAIPRGASSMQVKLTVNSDGAVSMVDWNDGAGPQPINREGKPIGDNNGKSEIVGRTLFVGETPKR